METTENRKAIEEAVRHFPSMPSLYHKLIASLHDPDLDMQVLARMVQCDPGMTANVLKLANSALFGAARQIDSIQTAFVRLGTTQLLQMAVLGGVSRFLRAPLVGYGLRPNELLSHSLWVAVAAEELARMLWVPKPAMAFTAGLLHDMGKVVVDEFIRQNWKELESRIEVPGASFDRVEHDVLGMDHAEAGALLLDQWKLPEALVTAVRWHHDPMQGQDSTRILALVHVADGLSYSEGIGVGVDGFKYDISKDVIDSLGLRHSMVEKVASLALDRVRSVEEALRG